MHHNFKVLSGNDLEKININLSEAAKIIEESIISIGIGVSQNPTKLCLVPTKHSIAYAMLGESSANQTVGMKNSYKFIPADRQSRMHYYTFLSLFDKENGCPLALMDCFLITAIRTSLVTALMVRECAKQNATRALIIGSGTQGRFAIPSLLECNPGIEEIFIFGHYIHSLEQILNESKTKYPDKKISIATDLEVAVKNAEIIVGVAGATSQESAKAEWVQPGTLIVLVGHGIDAEALHQADHVITTSISQMEATGKDLADKDGKLPKVDAELYELFLKNKLCRVTDNEKIFAYNSGLVVTDIALGRMLYEEATSRNIGQEITLW